MIFNTVIKLVLLLVVFVCHVSADYLKMRIWAYSPPDFDNVEVWSDSNIKLCQYPIGQKKVNYYTDSTFDYSPSNCDNAEKYPEIAVIDMNSGQFVYLSTTFEVALRNGSRYACKPFVYVQPNSNPSALAIPNYTFSCAFTITATTTTAKTTTTTTSTTTTTTTPTSTTMKITTTKTTTVAPTCISGYKGKKDGKGSLNTCCTTQWDCINECINGKCNSPDGKTTTTTKKTTTAKTTTAVPTFISCISGYKGKKNGKGPLNACCITQWDCVNECINGKCNNPDGKNATTKKPTAITTLTTKKITTTTAKPITTVCTSGYSGKKNGNGPLNACCTTQWDCINECINGKCNT